MSSGRIDRKQRSRRAREMGESLGVKAAAKHCRPLQECWRETR